MTADPTDEEMVDRVDEPVPDPDGSDRDGSVYDFAASTIGSLACFFQQTSPDIWPDLSGNGHDARIVVR